MKLVQFRAPLFMRLDASTKFLCLLGAVLTCSYTLNAVLVFDDLNFEAIFPGFVEKYGYIKTCWVLLSGLDMPNEYRTYELSRLLQFLLWSLGEQSYLYSLTIALTQTGTAIVLLYLARERGVEESASLAIAIIWLMSPFSINWCFHHYSYLILPFQINIFTCWILGRISTAPYRYIVVFLLGVSCALSGEMFLISGPLALVLVSWNSSDKSRRLLALATIVVMLMALALHRWVWTLFFQGNPLNQRFDMSMGVGFEVFASRTFVALKSIYRSIELQLREILRSGFSWGVIIGCLTAVPYWFLSKRSDNASKIENFTARSKFLTGINLAILFFILAISSLLIVLTISILSGQVYEILPRRYGYVSFTLLLLTVTVLISYLSGIAFGTKKLPLTIFVWIVSGLSGQLLFGEIPKVRAEDKRLIGLIKEAAGLNNDHVKSDKGVLFYVSENDQYQRGNANGATPGPLMDGQVGAELFESPFSRYWTSASLGINVLRFDFAGIPISDIEAGKIKLGGESGYPSSKGLNDVLSDSVVVVANLGFEAQDPLGRNVQVFKTFSEFQPHFFGRRIKREIFTIGGMPIDEVVIDLGLSQQSQKRASGVMLDKKFSEKISSFDQKWIENYGLLNGQDFSYTNHDISSALDYYRTNRNGAFTYGVTFQATEMVEVSLDFWEQWRSFSGERIFEVEISWDGVTWASLGNIDLVSLNKNKPFSIVLIKRNPKMFQFRLKSVPGSLDVPVIHGLRLRRLP